MCVRRTRNLAKVSPRVSAETLNRIFRIPSGTLGVLLRRLIADGAEQPCLQKDASRLFRNNADSGLGLLVDLAADYSLPEP